MINTRQHQDTNSPNGTTDTQHTRPNTHPRLIPNTRPSRIPLRKNEDPFALAAYGTSIYKKKSNSALRIFFQNIKGLSHCTNGEDYRYVMQQLAELQVDISGMAETNTAWQHSFLRHEFKSAIRASGIDTSKVNFGSPTRAVDNIPPNETFQAGGSITSTLGPWTTAVFGPEISDPTGLGRWSGLHIRGRHNNTLSLITGYRSCSGSKFTAPLGSTYHREYEYFRTQNAHMNPNPRLQFIKDVETTIQNLQEQGNMIILMLDANGALHKDIYNNQIIKVFPLSTTFHCARSRVGTLPGPFIRSHLSKARDLDSLVA